jgi:hypothetical protein
MKTNATHIYPDMCNLNQKLFKSDIKNLNDFLISAFSNSLKLENSNSKKKVAVAVGSRKINNINLVVKHCVNYLKIKGYSPYVIPAMGSHGGATAKGQAEILKKFGINENSVHAPIISDMKVEKIGTLSCGLNIYFSKNALDADHIVVINRVKPHTKFSGDIESGLCKMLTIGLGKHKGAEEYHQYAVNNSFGIIKEAAEIILKKCNILFGIALLEDGYGKLADIQPIKSSFIIDQEKKLLVKAKTMMSKIPFDYLDILIVDHIGKDISGIGMDSNITGRHRDIVGDFITYPHVKRIFVKDLSPTSDGNGNGIGLADFTSKRLVDKLDFEKTYVNALTAISPEKASIPMYFDNDLKAINACASTIGLKNTKYARIVRIKNTSNLETIQVSKAFESELSNAPNLKQISPWAPFTFDSDGNLKNFL